MRKHKSWKKILGPSNTQRTHVYPKLIVINLLLIYRIFDPLNHSLAQSVLFSESSYVATLYKFSHKYIFKVRIQSIETRRFLQYFLSKYSQKLRKCDPKVNVKLFKRAKYGETSSTAIPFEIIYFQYTNIYGTRFIEGVLILKIS